MHVARIATKKYRPIVLLVLIAGCGGYSTVSPDAYQYSKALYSICNRQDQSRLIEVATRVEAARATAELNEQEIEWLNDIITTAEDGVWEEATLMARELMEAQVRRE